jgi:class 3 adenylate cyclase/tetratricopeptide (TPR) repeat protein
MLHTTPAYCYAAGDAMDAMQQPRSTVPPAPGAEQSVAERRQLTLLFCDLAGSTALSARLDPEDLREVMARYYEVASEVFKQHAGYIAEFLGDGLLVYFSWPTAREHDAERAVRAGLAAAEAVAQITTPAGSLAVRVGIATGPVVVGDILNSDETRKRNVIGETPNLAARLQSQANPGEIVADETTRRLTGAMFEWVNLGASELKGLPHPVRIWRAVGKAAVASRSEALHTRRLSPLIGREEELELLVRRWRRAASGEGQIVLISGEAGIGKSRLVAALQEAIAASGDNCERLEWFCSPHYRDSALHPVIARLERAAGFMHEDAPEVRLAKLEASLAAGHPTPEEFSLVADLLGVPTRGRHPRLDLSPQLRRERTLGALLRRAEALANAQPVLGVLEDRHWADPTTLELLEMLAARVESLRLLLVITNRPEFCTPWAGQARVTELRLNRLGRRDKAALIEQVAGGAGTLSPEVVEEIAERTDGVPLFIEELTKAAVEAGGEANLQAFPAAAAVPATLYTSLTARLDRLGAAARQVAQASAAIGREFDHDLLAAIAGVPRDAFESALRRLEDAELIHRSGVPPEATYSFRHALLRDAAYGMLLRDPRRALHARIAEAIARLRPEAAEREPQSLAWHYAGAGLAERAIGYWRRAGERSVAQFANREAVGYFQRALQLIEVLPPGAERDRLEADLRLSLVVPLRDIHGSGSDAVEACAARAKELGERLPGWPGRFAAHRVVLGSCLARQPVPRAVALARDLMSLAEGSGDPIPIAIACQALGYSLYITGKPAEADSVLARGIDLADSSGGTEFAAYGQDPRIVCRLDRAQARCLLGYPDTGLRVVEEGLARARAHNNPYAIAWSLVVLADIHTCLRNAAGAEQAAAEATNIARQDCLAQWLARAPQRRGLALCQLGDPHQGLALLEEGLHRQHATRHIMGTTRTYFYLAEGYLLAGRPDAALGHVEAAHRHADTYGEHYLSAEIHRLHAQVLQIQGAPAPEIERHLRSALDIARQQAARLLELRAATALARLWHVQGRVKEAHGLLAPIYASFTEGFDLPDLIEARALLSGASGIQGPNHD